MAWKPKVQDGMMMGAPDGGLVRVFNPPRWRLDRWVGWFLGLLADCLQGGTGARCNVVLTFISPGRAIVEVTVCAERVERVQISKYNVVASAIRKL